MSYLRQFVVLIIMMILTIPCLGFEREITQDFHISSGTGPTTLTLLSFHQPSSANIVVPYNGDISQLIQRFNKYRVLYTAGQGVHAGTRVHTVLKR